MSSHMQTRKVDQGLYFFMGAAAVRFLVGKKHKLGLFGISKGAEQSLILASYANQIQTKLDAIAVHAPSDVTAPGVNTSWQDGRCWKCDLRAKGCTDSPQNWNPKCGRSGCRLLHSHAEIKGHIWQSKPIRFFSAGFISESLLVTLLTSVIFDDRDRTTGLINIEYLFTLL